VRAPLLLVVPVVELAVEDGDEQRVLPEGVVAVVVLQRLPAEVAAIWDQFDESGANPATSIYNASIVKIYSATVSMVRL
jgi:hypothetical protein